MCGSMQQPYANIYLLYVSPNGYRPQSYLYETTNRILSLVCDLNPSHNKIVISQFCLTNEDWNKKVSLVNKTCVVCITILLFFGVESVDKLPVYLDFVTIWDNM